MLQANSLAVNTNPEVQLGLTGRGKALKVSPMSLHYILSW